MQWLRSGSLAHRPSLVALASAPLVLVVLAALSALLAAGCGNGIRGNRDGGDNDGSMMRVDGSIPPIDARCGPAGETCCAGRTCELGLRCGRGDRCCIQPGGPTCDSASDCCTGLTCQGGNCCTPRGGACTGSSDCCTGFICNAGVCVSPEDDLPPGMGDCGGTGGVCCAGFTCRSGLVCSEGRCGACGDEGDACCDGATACTGSLACVRGTCTRVPSPEEACGTIDRPPCGMDGMPSTDCAGAECEGDLVCSAGMCLDMDDTGFEGAPCTPRGNCDPGLICDRTMGAGTCVTTPEDCGRDMQMCCMLGGTEGGCEGALNCQFGSCTTCQGPSLTCVLGGLLPGQQCCNGSVCRSAPIVPRCCVGEAQACSSSLDCCGFMMCRDGMCQAGREGSLCIDSSECGEGLTCQTFTCQPEGPMCTEPNEVCDRMSTGTCCDGLACSRAPRPEDPTGSLPEPRCCAAADASCTGDFDCCGEMRCEEGVCACRGLEETCYGDTDCCDGASCIGGACRDTTGCNEPGQTCTTRDDCCLGTQNCEPVSFGATETRCCVSGGQRCVDTTDCCGTMECGMDGTCECHRLMEPCASDADCCGALFCVDGSCSNM